MPRTKPQLWSVEEHASFLEGLQKLGRGNWKGIATHFVPTRTPTQVASHAQKHFMRNAKDARLKKQKRRASIFDEVSPASSCSTQGTTTAAAATPEPDEAVTQALLIQRHAWEATLQLHRAIVHEIRRPTPTRALPGWIPNLM